VIWREKNDDLAERCVKCGKPILGLKRNQLQSARAFHPECLPVRQKPSR
jgi:hypothetical protein